MGVSVELASPTFNRTPALHPRLKALDLDGVSVTFVGTHWGDVTKTVQRPSIRKQVKKGCVYD
jgi:hypothetical protein